MQAPVSVIIPTYNRCKSVCTAIESVQQQTRAAAEIIVIDDGSTDNTAATLSNRFDDIRVIEQENHGVSHARNQGISAALSPWVAFLDSDDRWFKEKLAVQFEAINQTPDAALCHCDEHWIRNGKRVNPMNKHKKRGGWIFEYCLPLCAISPSASMVRKAIFDEVGYFDESLPACEDYDLWLRICSRYPALYVDQALLEKTGGHDDQLSRAYWGMDRFRLVALAKLLRSSTGTSTLSAEQRQLTQATFVQKHKILLKGAVKRNNVALETELNTLYADLL